jgi:hypothetical protein
MEAAMPKHVYCESCKFWDNSASSPDSDEDTGQCRRLPPGFDSRTGLAVWPFVEDRDWCGMHVPDPDFVDPDGTETEQELSAPGGEQ